MEFAKLWIVMRGQEQIGVYPQLGVFKWELGVPHFQTLFV